MTHPFTSLRRAILRGLIVAASLLPGFSQAELKVGDAAPKIQVAKWVQGEAVKDYAGDKVYVVEFWATWCGPCVASIPHLNEIAEKYKSKGLVVVGQNLGEDAATISAFVSKMGAKMTYRVTQDDPAGGGFMAKNWLTAAGQNGIPCAFVVNKKGRLAFIGHPMSMEESMIEKLLDEPGTAPPEAAAPTGDRSTAPSAKALELAAKAQAEIAAGKLDEAEATLAGLHEALTENFRHIGGLLDLDLLLARQQDDDALQLAALLCDDFAKNPAVRVQVAACLAGGAKPAPKVLETAQKIADPIAAAAGAPQSTALSTLARIAFLRGEKDKAVEWQTKAAKAAAPGQAAAAKAALESYQGGKLPDAVVQPSR